MKRHIVAITAALAVLSLASACGADSSKTNPA